MKVWTRNHAGLPQPKNPTCLPEGAGQPEPWLAVGQFGLLTPESGLTSKQI